MNHLLIVGRKFSSLTHYLTDNGIEYTVLKDKLEAVSPEKKLKHRVVCDFSSRETVLKAVDSIKHPIDGVITTYENYVLPAAWIAEYLNLPAISEAAALACTDKFLMRQAFARAPEKISPDFAIADSIQEALTFARNHRFPLILKPANLAKSLLVTKSHTEEELIENYVRTAVQIEGVYNKYAPNRTPKMVIEEFLEGSIHSVDAFVNAAGDPLILESVVDYESGYDIGYDDNFHYSRLLPSRLSPNELTRLRHCAELGIRALGMTNCPAHVEIIVTNDGPRIVEIGARNGGYRERMHRLANGVDITGAAVSLALGKAPEVTVQRNESCAVLELFPKTPGRFVSISCYDDLKKLSSLQYVSLKVQPNDFVGKSSDGYKMCAVVILHNVNHKVFAKDLAFVNGHVAVVTR